MSRAVVYEWDACSDKLGGMNNAVKTNWAFPTEAFNWYKSAEIHTKQKFKLPLWFGLLPLGVAACVYFFPMAYQSIANPKSSTTTAAKPATAGAGQVAAVAATPAASQLVGYYRVGLQCFGINKTGDTVTEPPSCREKLQ